MKNRPQIQRVKKLSQWFFSQSVAKERINVWKNILQKDVKSFRINPKSICCCWCFKGWQHFYFHLKMCNLVISPLYMSFHEEVKLDEDARSHLQNLPFARFPLPLFLTLSPSPSIPPSLSLSPSNSLALSLPLPPYITLSLPLPLSLSVLNLYLSLKILQDASKKLCKLCSDLEKKLIFIPYACCLISRL